ncbi:MAG: hypothetical protein ACI8PZ_002981 [Myxococcota bacterium]|jgi:hypothetical protein
MRSALLGLMLLVAPIATAAEVDVSPALVAADKPRWEPKGKDAQALRGQARTKLKGKKYDDAVPMYMELMGIQPGCGVCLAELTKALANGGHSAEALRTAAHLTTLFPELQDSWSRQLEAALVAREFDVALSAVRKLQQMAPSSFEHKWTEVELLLIRGEADAATAALESVGELKEGDVACMRARVLYATNSPEADAVWETCEADGTEGASDRVGGWRAIAQRDWETAALHAAQLGEAAAGDLAVAYLRMEESKPDSAVNLLNAAIKHHPEGRDLHVLHALAAYRAGNADTAKASLEAQAALGDAGYWVLAAAHIDWPARMARHIAAVQAALAADAGQDSAGVLAAAVAAHGEGPELAWIREALAEAAPDAE